METRVLLEKVIDGFAVPGKNRAEKALEYLRYSTTQLAASKYLYSKKLNKEAVFLLQQSVENAAKAFETLALPNANGKNIRHAPLKVLRDHVPVLLQNFSNYVKIMEDISGIFSNQSGVGKFISERSGVKKKRDQTKANYDKIMTLSPAYIKRIDDIIKATTDKGTNVGDRRKFWEQTLNLSDDAEAQFRNLLHDSDSANKRARSHKLGLLLVGPFVGLAVGKAHSKKFRASVKYTISIYFFAFTRLFSLAYLTTLHQQPTRYPKTDGNDYWDSDAYTRDKPLVRNLSMLLRETSALNKAIKSASVAVIDYHG